jgi:hypothetical protein
MLTEEERRTLIAEGYPIPQKFPLSKSEERSLKKIRRKIKNKISAQESRRKKKEYMEELEKRVQMMEMRIAELEQENRRLSSATNAMTTTTTTATTTTIRSENNSRQRTQQQQRQRAGANVGGQHLDGTLSPSAASDDRAQRLAKSIVIGGGRDNDKGAAKQAADDKQTVGANRDEQAPAELRTDNKANQQIDDDHGGQGRLVSAQTTTSPTAIATTTTTTTATADNGDGPMMAVVECAVPSDRQRTADAIDGPGQPQLKQEQRKNSIQSNFSTTTNDDEFIDDILMSQEAAAVGQLDASGDDDLVGNLVGDDDVCGVDLQQVMAAVVESSSSSSAVQGSQESREVARIKAEPN